MISLGIALVPPIVNVTIITKSEKRFPVDSLSKEMFASLSKTSLKNVFAPLPPWFNGKVAKTKKKD
jgi:hypothetical protein